MTKKNSKKVKSNGIKKSNNNVQNKLLNLKFGFDDFMNDFFKMPSIFDDNFFIKNDLNIPSINLSETKDDYKVSVELAGIDKNDINLSLSNNVLSIDAEKSSEDSEKGENFYRQECSYGSFHRSIKMPDDIKPETMDAKYKNGVLKITVKKDKSAKKNTRKINIK